MNEFELISRLTRSLPTNDSVVVGAGDDCAVLDVGANDRLLLFKTDAVVEGVHFTCETPPEKIGHKALARCLSDIAAMAGTPTAAVITIGLPKQFNPDLIERIYGGLNSVSLVGFVPRERLLLRSRSKVGDAIFVTGELGGSIAGRHLDFDPRLTEARWLAENFQVHSLIDISDGLAGDLRHILTTSNVGAELLRSAIPISRAAHEISRRGDAAKPALVAALTDGEDFELLFTIASKSAVPLIDAWKKQFPKVKLSCIGKIIPGDGIKLRDETGVRPLTARGYVHFS
jgi:thiamine-monophosphate kinase